MTAILLDDEPVLDLHAAQTVGQVLEAIRTRLRSDGRMITSLCCDGEAISGDGLAAAMDRPLNAVGRLALESDLTRGLVLSILRQCRTSAADAQAARERIADALAQGCMTDAMRQMTELLRDWSQMLSAVMQATQAMEIDLERVELPSAGGHHGIRSESEDPNGEPLTVMACLAHVTESLRQLRSSLMAQDFVVLGDQFRYELESTLTAWSSMIDGLISHIERP